MILPICFHDDTSVDKSICGNALLGGLLEYQATQNILVSTLGSVSIYIDSNITFSMTMS